MLSIGLPKGLFYSKLGPCWVRGLLVLVFDTGAMAGEVPFWG